jgi:hypothetical protein
VFSLVGGVLAAVLVTSAPPAGATQNTTNVADCFYVTSTTNPILLVNGTQAQSVEEPSGEPSSMGDILNVTGGNEVYVECVKSSLPTSIGGASVAINVVVETSPLGIVIDNNNNSIYESSCGADAASSGPSACLSDGNAPYLATTNKNPFTSAACPTGDECATFYMQETGNSTFPFNSYDPNAQCPPTAAQVNAGLTSCVLAVFATTNATTGAGVSVNANPVTYASQATGVSNPLPTPNPPTLKLTPSSGPPGASVSVSDVSSPSGYWWSDAMYSDGYNSAGGANGDSPLLNSFSVPATDILVGDATAASSSVVVSPATYSTSVTGTCPVGTSGGTCTVSGTLTPPAISGSFTLPSSMSAGANTVTIYEPDNAYATGNVTAPPSGVTLGANSTTPDISASATYTPGNAADGSGTMTVAPSSVTPSSTGNTLTFTYTAAPGGTNDGEIDVAVPSGWSAPSTTSSDAGYSTSTCGTVAVSSSTIEVTGVSVSGEGTCTITYGSKASSGPGATAPSTSGIDTFNTTEMSTSTGTLTALAVSPTVTVLSTDGSGTMTVVPTSVFVSSTTNMLTFTYTAATGGTNDGEIDVVVPSGWSAPSTTSSDAGYSTSTCGTVAVSSSTIEVTGVTLSGGGTCTITYGSKAGSGPGATAPSTTGNDTFNTTEMSTSTGTLTALAASPAVTVSPNPCAAYTGNEAFLCQTYEILFTRVPDSAGLSYWNAQLTAGVSRSAVAYDITTSSEYRNDLVSNAYENYLGRAADSSDLAYWVAQLNSGATDESVLASILGSDEYYTDSGGTADDFVTALYDDVLARDPDANGLTYWESQLSSGMSRTAVAASFLFSTEYRTDLVNGYYETFLRRVSDSDGLNYWVARLAAGASDESVISNFLGSAEFYTDATNA